MKPRTLADEKLVLSQALAFFFNDCRARLFTMADSGKRGWDDPSCGDALAIDLMDDAEKAVLCRDRLHLHDIANRAMMLWWQEYRSTVRYVPGYTTPRWAKKKQIVTNGAKAVITIVAVAIAAGCSSLQDAVESIQVPATPEPSLPTVHTGPIAGFMATDWICDRDLTAVREDDAERLLEAGYKDIYTVADLWLPRTKARRDYVGQARTERALTDLGVANGNWIQARFRLILAIDSIPFVDSANQAGLGYRPGLTEDHPWFYGPEHLDNTKACWTDACTRLARPLHAAVLFLEPRSPRSIEFQRQVALHLRSIGYDGLILYNGIMGATLSQQQLDAWGLSVKTFRSINSVQEWRQSDQWCRNADGMFELTPATAPAILPVITSTPGPGGAMVWDAAARGGEQGRCLPLPDYLFRHVRWQI